MKTQQKVSQPTHTPTPYQIHFLGDNARTELEKCYPFVVVEKSDYHNWAEELPSGDDILAYFADQPTALKFVRAVNSHEALLQALKDLASEINLSKLNVRKDFHLMNVHACALKAIAQASEGKV